MVNLQPPSVQSLFLQFKFNGQPLGTGTGFLARHKNGLILLTARHNVTGRHNSSGELLCTHAGIPNEVEVWHHYKGNIGKWVGCVEKLLAPDGTPLWVEHPRFGAKVDFVGLALKELKSAQFFPYESLGLNDPLINVKPSDSVSVVGFPFGISSGGGLPIWMTGSIATELDIDHDHLPLFLIDCRSRSGLSGAPVIAHRSGGTVNLESGDSTIFDGPVTRFLGLYSGRLNKESDIGFVWKAAALRELVESIKP